MDLIAHVNAKAAKLKVQVNYWAMQETAYYIDGYVTLGRFEDHAFTLLAAYHEFGHHVAGDSIPRGYPLERFCWRWALSELHADGFASIITLTRLKRVVRYLRGYRE